MLLERIRALISRRRLERDLDDELAFHLAMRAEKEGALAARRRFGNATRIRETCRDLWTFAAVETLAQDLRYAVRTLISSPGFTSVAVVSLALGIGANASLFSLMDVMLLRALPVSHPEELVEFVRAHPEGARMTNLPIEVFRHFQRDCAGVLSEILAVSPASDVFRAAGPPLRATTHEVSGSYFPMLGVAPLAGRALSPDDDRPGAASAVAILSYGLWTRQFGRDPNAVGATVRISDKPVTIVGVMPPAFVGIDRANVPDLWVPIARDQASRYVWVIARLRPGITLERARAALSPAFTSGLMDVAAKFPRSTDQERREFASQWLLVNRAAEGTSIIRWTYWNHVSAIKILLGLTGLVLLIACTNLANLLMARAAARSREIAIRVAVGAGRWRVARQLMTENLLLALAGGALGLVASRWGHMLLVGFLVANPDRAALDYRLDYRLVLFGFALSIATALAFGLFPAVRATRSDPAAALYGARQTGVARAPFARVLLAIQIALSTVLLTGAALFSRSLHNLVAADLGFSRESLLLADVRPTAKTPEDRARFWRDVLRRVASQPGVRSVAIAGDAVFGNGGWNQTIWIDRHGETPRAVKVSDNLVSVGFFSTTGVPVLRGREFTEQDRDGGPRVALVNQTFARRYFGAEDPIGKRIGDMGAESASRIEIVGVVGDAKYGAVRERARPMVFHPLYQFTGPHASWVVHVRTAASPESVAPALRQSILDADDGALVSETRTLPQIVSRQLREDRMFATLTAFFALLAMALGAIGIYGVLAYRVARRTSEIGVRVALGARRANVLWLVLRETAVLLAIGIAFGLPATIAAARLVKTVLYGVDPLDPLSLVSAAVVLIAAGCVAGYLPARRAASIQPVDALRAD